MPVPYRISYNQILDLVFYGLSVIIFLNLNGIVNLLINITAPFSPLILLFSLIALAIFFKQRVKLGILMALFTFTMLSYLVIGTISYGWNYFEGINAVGFYKPTRDVITSLIVTLVYYFLFKKYKKEGKFIKRLSVVLLFGMISVFVTIFGMYLGFYDNMQGINLILVEQRSMGVFANPNQAGVQANLILISILFLFLTNTKYKWLLILLLLFVVYASFRTFSKGAMISSVFILTIFFGLLATNILRINARAKRGALLLASCLAGVGVYLVANFNKFVQYFNINQIERVVSSFELVVNRKFDSETTSNRDGLIEYGWEMIQARPILGSGLGSFHKFVAPGFTHGSHNQYMNIIGEAGVFPFLIILLFFGLAVWYTYSNKNTAIRFLGFSFLFFILFNGLVTQTLFREKSVVAFIGIVLAILDRKNLKLI